MTIVNLPSLGISMGLKWKLGLRKPVSAPMMTSFIPFGRQLGFS
ncbi:hypothetical protein [cyanobacterium endosymbiont of Rhopalodia gibberula]|nr:hypothetical protein [cyanobacterium endosymbiont of Rhopalodia gibberula]